jgi:hypothetical protein
MFHLTDPSPTGNGWHLGRPGRWPEVLSFGGVPLKGDRLVRLTFLDEAGISNPTQEPIVVIAGIVVHGDVQYKPLRARIQKVVEDWIPPQDRDGFIFHATDLFSGGGYFSRNLWPLCIRWQILEELCSIPYEFDLPIVFGFQNRWAVPRTFEGKAVKDNIHTAAMQLIAFTHCLIGIERWMRAETDPSENVMLIAEDKPEVKSAFKEIHRVAQNPDKIKQSIPAKLAESEELPVTRIVDDIYFTDKQGSVPLQIADVCAFVIKRHLMKRDYIYRFYGHLRPQLIWKESAVAFEGLPS